ncbi:MAG: TetR family transcriptional regulator [Propionibacteriaceae bacterium]
MNATDQPATIRDHSPRDDRAGLSLRERRRQATVNEIGEAALDLFEIQGVAATTIADIARATGISDRTFFRYFSSKEETVLDFQQWFDAPTRAWLGDGRSEQPVLEQLETVCIGVLRDLDGPRSEAAARLRRIRKLMKSEPSLRALSAMHDDQHAHALADQIVLHFDGQVSLLEARLAAQIVGVGLRAACEDWSTRLDQHEAATLEASYRLVRDTIASLVTPTNPHHR